MNITFNKGKPYEEVFTTEEIKSMTKEQLKSLKQRCMESIAEISNKRSHYKNENTEETNSKEFWTKMNNYKAAITIYQRYIGYLSDVERAKEPTRDQKDNEHWLWCYYQESLKMLTDDMVEQIKDFYGKIIGTIETQSNGDKIVRDFYGKILGYYRCSRNVTTDFYGKIVAQGDATGMLLANARR